MSHSNNDAHKGRVPEAPLTPEAMYAKWRDAGMVCAYSGVMTTIENGPLRVSLDRVAHGVAHEASTTRIVCRMLNSAAGMSRAKFITIMLRQGLVPLKPVVRLAYAAELVRLQGRLNW